MYAYGWIALVVVSLGISLVAFVWGVSTGQFADQARARYFPLRGMSVQSPEVAPSRLPTDAYVFAVIIVVGIAVMLAPVLVSLWHTLHGGVR